jgi:hypothetical protein
MLRVEPCPLPLEYQVASSQARLKSCWALPPWSKPLYPTTAVPGEVGGELGVVHGEHHEAKQEAGQHAQAPRAKIQPVNKSQEWVRILVCMYV